MNIQIMFKNGDSIKGIFGGPNSVSEEIKTALKNDKFLFMEDQGNYIAINTSAILYVKVIQDCNNASRDPRQGREVR